jgi:acetyl-CoA carboxylase biotin carboxyl carrier protein
MANDKGLMTGGNDTVADDSKHPGGPFDLRTIRLLAALMSQHELHEIDLREGGRRIRLLRGGPVGPPPPLHVYAPGAPLHAPPPASAPADQTAAAEKPTRNLLEIKSELVGTFYARPNPDAELYVKVGSRVTPATVVGLIEAMKLYNDVQANCSGVVAEILVENQQAVEFGQVLFRVDPTA